MIGCVWTIGSSFFHPHSQVATANETFSNGDLSFNYPNDLKVVDIGPSGDGVTLNNSNNNDSLSVSTYGPIEGDDTWQDLIDQIVKSGGYNNGSTTYKLADGEYEVFTFEVGDDLYYMQEYAINKGGKCYYIIDDNSSISNEDIKTVINTIH